MENSSSSAIASTDVLDDLMNLSGELILVRNELSEASRRSSQGKDRPAVQRLKAVTMALQDAVMRTRTRAASTLFAPCEGIVRDLSRELGKDIDLGLSGGETELDRALVEALGKPLILLVREACEQGIETPDTRAACGKGRRGNITLSALHEAGQVVIAVEDDGAGIDARGVDASESDETLKSAKAVVESLGGRVDIETSAGLGTKVRIALPLTLSIMPALLVGIDAERFALPQTAVAELIHIRVGDVHRRIERLGDRPALVLRGEVLPLLRFAEVVGIEQRFEDPGTGQAAPDRRRNLLDPRVPATEAEGKGQRELMQVGAPPVEERRFRAASDYRIVVVRAAGFRYGVVVDELFDTTEVVVKALGRHLKGLKEYSGATILGDGSVALIVDPVGFALKAGLTATGEDHSASSEDEVATEEEKGWLLFRNGKVEQCAMPLEAVDRVVRVSKEDLDLIGGDYYLRIDGHSLPVFPIASFTGLTKLDAESAEACVLCHVAEHRFGFLASPPVDSIAAEASLDRQSLERPGVSGTAVIQGYTTVVIDPAGALAALKPEWFAKTCEEARKKDDK
jgi:two-component system chemotaxis sensor kinase CheA